jgi:hypothetical protein
VTPVPDGHHQFSIGVGQIVDVPLKPATLLGWILPGERAEVSGAQFSPDGRALYVASGRGVCEQLASATLTRPSAGTVEVDVRLTGCPPLPLAGDAALWLFATVISLDPPIDPQNPPVVLDAATGATVKVELFIP